MENIYRDYSLIPEFKKDIALIPGARIPMLMVSPQPMIWFWVSYGGSITILFKGLILFNAFCTKRPTP